MDRKAFLELLCEASAEPVLVRLHRSGVSDAQVDELLAEPQTAEALWSTATRRFLLPAVPSILRDLARRAEKGDFTAQRLVVELLGEKSPVREKMGLDLSSADDAALKRLALQLGRQLLKGSPEV